MIRTGTRRFRRISALLLASALGMVIGITGATAAAAAPAPAPVDLGTADTFGVLGAATVTSTGPTAVSGNVGVSPGTAITGFPPGIVTHGGLQPGNPAAAAAHDDAATAYADAAGRVATPLASAALGGTTLTPGVYSGIALTVAGTVTLDAQGDPNAVFVIKSSSTLTTSVDSHIALSGGASACNVFWQVGSSATLGVGTAFAGTVLAEASVTATTGVSVSGRLLAVNAAVTLDSNSITTPTCASVALATSVSTVRFGSSVTLTATVGPPAATGTVEFADVPSTGASSNTTVVLGTATVSGGVATLTRALPAFGVNLVTARYQGDATYGPGTSDPVSVEVAAYAGELVVSEFRLSSPSGDGDSYIDLYNTGAPVPLAGFVVKATAASDMILPANAGILGTNRSYLLTGSSYSLGGVATSDDSVSTTMGGAAAGIKVQAPDTALTRTDAVGPRDQEYSSGTTALPLMSGSPTASYAWVRNESAGRPVWTGDNTADFTLVSTTGGPIGGVPSTLGSPAPIGTTTPYQHNSVLGSTLLDASVGSQAGPNRAYTAGSPGMLTIRRTITNSGSAPITSARIRITALSEAGGRPEPGVGTPPTTVADLEILRRSGSSSVSTSTGNVTVYNLAPDSPATGAGGLNTTLTVPLPNGGLAAGATISVAFTFAVETHGTYWFGYDVDASSSGQTSQNLKRTLLRTQTPKLAVARGNTAGATGRIG